MAPSRASFTHCEGAPAWNPSALVCDDKDSSGASGQLEAAALAHLDRDDLASATRTAFSLPARDAYVYHAMVSVTLAQVQHAVALGGANRLHAWYRDPDDPSNPAPPPPRPDTDAYLAIFDPATATASALKSLAANARKASLRARVADHLLRKRYLHPARPELQIPRLKSKASKNKKDKIDGAGSAAEPSNNPYLPFLTWAARNLEWAGPCDLSESVPTSHHVLPVLMHHFGCACPSYEALEILRLVADGRPVVDMGSGNGYWTFMLRRHGGLAAVHPVDSAQSSWRVNWVADTEVADGAAWLGRRGGAPDAVLLLVYPIVGGGVAGGREGGFTRDMLAAYRGDTLAVVGTQNRNGYTGFRGESMEQFMAREHPDWTRVAQVALPSFPGKDEALFVFQRGDRAPREAAPAEG